MKVFMEIILFLLIGFVCAIRKFIPIVNTTPNVDLINTNIARNKNNSIDMFYYHPMNPAQIAFLFV